MSTPQLERPQFMSLAAISRQAGLDSHVLSYLVRRGTIVPRRRDVYSFEDVHATLAALDLPPAGSPSGYFGNV